VKQLKTWGERNHVPVIAQKGDAAAVVSTLHRALAWHRSSHRGYRRGCLRSCTRWKSCKVKRVIARAMPEAP
jgi:hypothetical protein